MFFFILCSFMYFQNNFIDMWLNYFFFLITLLIVTYMNIVYIGKKGFFFINMLFISIWVLLSNFIFFKIWHSNICVFYDFFFIYYFDENIPICLNMYIDLYNYNYINLTLSIGGVTFVYAYSYMRDENYIEKFLFLLLSFLYSMIILLLSNNFILLLLGWELIGVTSYFLINFWIIKISTFKSAYKAFIFNRLSDLCIIVVLLLYLNFYNSWYLFIDTWYYHYNLFFYYEVCFMLVNGYDIMACFLIIAAFCKSAQFGFHNWLPDSMEAPVPASALIHSATLVSAGIYLLNKFWALIILSNFFIKICFLVSSWTALYGAIIAIYQTDLKRILAYSTISHCGVLVLISFLNNIHILCIYLYVHGLFKSLSFMCVGNIIKTSSNIQDYRYMGQKFITHKFEYYFLIISLINLSGYVFSIGFFGKHLMIITFLFLGYTYYIGFFFFFTTALIGFFYTFFLVNHVFFCFYKNFANTPLLLTTSYSTTTPLCQNAIICILWVQSLYHLIYFYSSVNYYNADLGDTIYLTTSYYFNQFFLIKSNFFYQYLNYFLWNFFFVFFIYLNFKNYFFSFLLIFFLFFLFFF